MNDFINWIAVNDTLLIRVGFTAVLVLIIVYVYRFFFVPKINIPVDESAARAGNEKSTLAENKPAEEKAASFDLSIVTKKTEEIESLKAEIAKLKVQAADSEKEISDLKEKAEMQSTVTAEANEEIATRSEAASVATSNNEASTSDLVSNLNTKIEQLESRLAEYEIIAEDISEISQLRQENAELKKKLAAEPADLIEATETPQTEEIIAEEPIVSEELIIAEEPIVVAEAV
ncbi:MAG: hypothetical protein ABL930_08975 [Pseudobdellovibrio sp.]